jgi:AbrB family looped-hinge helix DNA binding protein
MDSPHVVKVDSKGRILIPLHTRNSLGIEEGTEMIMVPDDENGHFKMLPISKNSTAEIKVMLEALSSFASVADTLSANAFNIILSESKRVGEELTEWKIIVDLADKNNGIDILRDVISNVEGVKSLDIIRR